MKNFNIIFEQYMLNNNQQQQKKEYRSLDEFRHFCDRLNLIVEPVNQSNISYIVKLYKFKNNKKQFFDYYYKFNPHYYAQNKNIFEALKSYREKYIVTVDGTENSKKVLY